ncbi:helix-turn-helix transcriptional regulator [Streptomyces sp. NPDC101776]|uniref:helix-turn-helix domain-containing protein n=1 Tax=Streptomyces sp. NPDC101776 TaxID=3366146 RepID=UPI00382AF103
MGAEGEVSMGRKLVGDLLRIHRARLGLTQKDASEIVRISESLFGAYERAERIPTTRFLEDVDGGLDGRGAFLACIEMMEEEKYPPKYLNWVRLQRLARIISGYETLVIPGLLQTEAYTRALYVSRVPAYTEEEIERHVGARLERQAVLTRNPPPRVSFVVEESALEREFGGPGVLKEQLLHLLELMRTVNHLTVQVMPTKRHVHAGLQGPMQLMSTEEGRNLVFVESQAGSTLISKPEQVNGLFDLYGMLRAQALTPWESAELIEDKAGRL